MPIKSARDLADDGTVEVQLRIFFAHYYRLHSVGYGKVMISQVCVCTQA